MLRLVRHVRRDIAVATIPDEVARVVALVSSQRDAAFSRQVVVDHFECHSPFGGAGCFGDAEIDEHPMAVLHERVGREGQLGLLPVAFAHQPRLWVSRGLMGVVSAPLPSEVDCRIR